ncbi:MAG: cell division protein ZapA [Bdellovibrionota bacterium]
MQNTAPKKNLSQKPTEQNKKSYDFLIAGVPYKLRTSHDEDLVQELVSFVDSKMKQALAASKNGSFQNAAVLTALHMAEELLLLKKKALAEIERVEQKALKLSLDLENSSFEKKKARPTHEPSA